MGIKYSKQVTEPTGEHWRRSLVS